MGEDFLVNYSTVKKAQPSEEQRNSLNKQLEAKDILEDIEDSLRGIKRNKNGEITNLSITTPLACEEFIDDVMSLLRSIINRNTFLANFDDKDIEFKMNNIMRAVRRLMKGYLREDINSIPEKNWTAIMEIIEEPVHAAITRPWGGLERKSARDIMQDSSNQTLSGMPPRAEENKGGLPIIGRFLK